VAGLRLGTSFRSFQSGRVQYLIAFAGVSGSIGG
jgi:hypothetical protein